MAISDKVTKAIAVYGATERSYQESLMAGNATGVIRVRKACAALIEAIEEEIEDKVDKACFRAATRKL